MKRVSKTRLGCVLLVATGILAGGLAAAAIPDGGVINGCYQKNGGTLRVIDQAAGERCRTNAENEIQWNQDGPRGAQGPQGLQGAQGVQGAQGPAGISTATFAQAYDVELADPFHASTKVVSKTLPAGNWVVIATVETVGSFDPHAVEHNVTCILMNGVVPFGGGDATDRRSSDFNTTVRLLTLMGGTVVPAGGSEISVQCYSQGAAGSERAAIAKVTFLQVGSFS
jgi:hypothetical protein